MLMYQKIRGYKYRVASRFHIDLPWLRGVEFDSEWINVDPIAGRLTAKPGYCWDGASGPTVDTPSSIRGSLWHDIGYQLIRMGVIQKHPFKELFDDLLRDTCIDAGMYEWRADLWHEGVLLIGEEWGLAGNDRHGEILIAP